MTTPFTKYLCIKDNYCLAYFGDDKETLSKIIEAREFIENELQGLKIFIACKDFFKNLVHGKRNIILESKMGDYQGKIACFRKLEEKDELMALLLESNIQIPKYF